MDFDDLKGVPLFLGFLFIVFQNFKSRAIEDEMYRKYDVRTWHTGFFKHRKMMKLLSEEDRLRYRAVNKKIARRQLYALLVVIVYSIVVGVCFPSK